MKQILVMMAAVVLVGCAKDTPETSQAAEAEPQVTPAAAPEPTPVSPADEKLIANPIVEESVRRRLKKSTGELTKADLEKVTFLNLDRNQLTDVKGLENLTQLKRLYLQRNKLTDVKGLEKLDQLTHLYLGGNQLTELPKGLENLTQLTSLSLFLNKLTDVTGLEKLTGLTRLSLDSNPDLTKAQIAELQKALPNCRIFSNATK